MDEIIPTIIEITTIPRVISPLNTHIDQVRLEGKNILENYFAYNRKRKQYAEASQTFLRTFMIENKSEIMQCVDRRNLNKGTSLTFENMVEIALGWDLNNINSLIKLAKKRKIREFMYRLYDY